MQEGNAHSRLPRTHKTHVHAAGNRILPRPQLPLGRSVQKEPRQFRRLEVYVDAGNIALKGKEYVCIVGDTDATIEAAGTKFIHTIILMHGARAKITAKDYAVLNIVRIDGEYSIKKDETVIVV